MFFFNQTSQFYNNVFLKIKNKFSYDSKIIDVLNDIFNSLKNDKDIGHLCNGIVITDNLKNNNFYYSYISDESLIYNDYMCDRSDESNTKFPIIINNFTMSLFLNNCNCKYDSNIIPNHIHINIDNHARKIKKYFICYDSILPILYSKLKNYVYECITIGKNNIILAVINCDMQLIIKWNVLMNIIEEYSYKQAKKYIKDILIEYNNSITNRVRNNLNDYRFITNEVINNINNLSDEISYKQIKKLIEDKCTIRNTRIKKIQDKHFKIYKDILNDVKQKQIVKINNALKDGYNKGIEIGNILSDLGWTVANKCNSIMFKKDINLVPTMFCYDGLMYKIKKKTNPFVINTLYYLPNSGNFQADGKHPNISGNGVCLGDLGNVLYNNDEKEEFINKIKQAEELLTIINYDSAFSMNYCDILRRPDNCERIEHGLNLVNDKIIDNDDSKTIRKISLTTKDKNESINEITLTDDDVKEIEENNNSTLNVNISDYSKLINILNVIENDCSIGDDTHINYDNDKFYKTYASMLVYKIRNYDRYLVVLCNNDVYKNYSPNKFYESDFDYFYYKNKNVKPFVVSMQLIRELCPFLTLVHHKSKTFEILYNTIHGLALSSKQGFHTIENESMNYFNYVSKEESNVI